MVDDIYLVGRDRSLAALSKHPHLDVRIFNPGRIRDSTLGALGEFLPKFRQLNRRMHNKLLVVDNLVAIVGGRNVGNAYFGLSEPYNFRDLDVLATGPVVEEISHAFDDYWNAEVAYPAEAMSARARVDEIGPLREEASEFVEADFISLHVKALIADRKACFVGSLNLDPRAVEINTENGLYLESEALCGALARQADQMMAPENAWRVDLDEQDDLRWTSVTSERSSPPARGFWQRVRDFFYGWLPIEGQL